MHAEVILSGWLDRALVTCEFTASMLENRVSLCVFSLTVKSQFPSGLHFSWLEATMDFKTIKEAHLPVSVPKARVAMWG